MSLNVILTISILVIGYFILVELAVITLWSLARFKKRPLTKDLIITVFIAALPVYFTLFQISELMVNFTPSLPVGVYRQMDTREISRGDIVSYCLDVPEYVALAKERGYLGAGNCCAGLKPLLKYAAGMPGDVVGVTEDDQITVNQKTLPNVYIAAEDLQGRAMPESVPFTGVIPTGKVFLVSYHLGGFDSRYFGLADINKLKQFKPVIIFKKGKYMQEKEYLKAAARAVEEQAEANPGLGIPVDPNLADFMGAFKENAVPTDDYMEEK